VKQFVVRLIVPGATALGVTLFSASFDASGNDPQGTYHVTHLSSLGGTNSRANSINSAGLVAGYSNLAGNQARHASVWIRGVQFDLGTLGGPNSSITWPVKNTSGIVAGISQTSRPDPLGEKWSCSAFFSGPNSAGLTCLGFVWSQGVMRPLPTLGGNNGFATGVNNRGEVVGWAENTVHDPTCAPPQVLQFRPVVWTDDGTRELPLIDGDTSGAATAINDRGQIVGISGICDQAVGRFTGAHAVLWDRDQVIDIGNLGGNTWNTPMAINHRGDIVGFASQAGDDPDNPRLRAFLWTRRDGVQNLGLLPGHFTSQANGINDHGQVVGTSCPASGPCRGFIWEDGVMTDLNALVQPGYSRQIESAQDINDASEIAGRALNLATNERVAMIATPIHGSK
jgi:probable HAF family extracellular repeat protein